MQCDEAVNLISADVDGELPADERLRLEDHLAQCADCRAAAEAIRLQDAQLVRAFAPRRGAAREIANRVTANLARSRPRRSRWLLPLAAAAAGFVAAVLIFRPWIRSVSIPNMGRTSAVVSIGHLDVATGVVECRVPGGQWQPMVTGAAVTAGSQIRTGTGVRCEFAMADGSEVRVNENSELRLADLRKLDHVKGQVFSVVARKQTPFELAFAGGTVTALGTRFDVQCRPNQLVLAVLSGSTKLTNGGTHQDITQGQVVNVVNGRVTQLREPHALDQATSWITDILVLKGPNNPELNARIDDLFAQIGEGKMAFMRENELKAMGDRCVIPLVRYLQSPRSAGKTFKRQEAARIVGDVAQPWCIPDLIELLGDSDGDVRALAAAALFRLTGLTQNRSTQQWHDEPAQSGRPALKDWQEWWRVNRHHYPLGQDARRVETDESA